MATPNIGLLYGMNAPQDNFAWDEERLAEEARQRAAERLRRSIGRPVDRSRGLIDSLAQRAVEASQPAWGEGTEPVRMVGHGMGSAYDASAPPGDVAGAAANPLDRQPTDFSSRSAPPNQPMEPPPPRPATNDPLSGEPVLFRNGEPVAKDGPPPMVPTEQELREPPPGAPMSLAPGMAQGEPPQASSIGMPQMQQPGQPPSAGGLGGILSKVLDPSKSATWLALGSGLMGAPSLGTGMSRAFANAVPAVAADRAYGQKLAGMNATAVALRKKGVPEEEIQAAINNPDILKGTIAKYFETKPSEWKQTGADMFGNSEYGWVNAQKETVNGVPVGKPQTPNVGTDPTYNAISAVAGKKIDPSLKAEDYLNQYPDQMQAAIRNMVDGRSMPTANARKGFTQAVKMAAGKYGEDIGVRVDETEFAQRRQFRNQLASGTPASVGGQRNTANTALEHLSEVAKLGNDLQNSDWYSTHLSRGVNWARGLTTEQQAKVNAYNTAVQRYGAEIIKFYAGSTGGVTERMATEERLGANRSPRELAGAMLAEKELLFGKLRAIEQQRDEVLGARRTGKTDPETNIFLKNGQDALKHLDAMLPKLRGEKTGASAPAASPPAAAAKPTADGWVEVSPGVRIRKVQ